MKYIILFFLIFGQQAACSEEADAFKKTLKAFSQTTTGRAMGKRLERQLYLHKIPDEIKKMHPFLTVLITKEIKFTWKY